MVTTTASLDRELATRTKRLIPIMILQIKEVDNFRNDNIVVRVFPSEDMPNTAPLFQRSEITLRLDVVDNLYKLCSILMFFLILDIRDNTSKDLPTDDLVPTPFIPKNEKLESTRRF